MSILESTISMTKALPEEDLIKIQDFTRKLFRLRKCETADHAVARILKPMSGKEFLDDVETAEREISAGKYRKAEELFDELDQRYGC